MWIMLTTKLPTVVSPPKMSIHWATPFPNKTIAGKQKEKMRRGFVIKEHNYLFDTLFRKEPDFANAIGILYKREKLRVFPHEFTKISNSKLQLYLNEQAYELIYEKELQQLFDINLTKKQKTIYEAALLDGCDHYQAIMVATGKDPTDDFPPIGWFKLCETYANYFCYANEQKE